MGCQALRSRHHARSAAWYAVAAGGQVVAMKLNMSQRGARRVCAGLVENAWSIGGAFTRSAPHARERAPWEAARCSSVNLPCCAQYMRHILQLLFLCLVVPADAARCLSGFGMRRKSSSCCSWTCRCVRKAWAQRSPSRIKGPSSCLNFAGAALRRCLSLLGACFSMVSMRSGPYS